MSFTLHKRQFNALEKCFKICHYIFIGKPRALVGGGAGGAIAPPTFLDLLNRYHFLSKNSNLFLSTSSGTPKKFLAPPISKCRRGPCRITTFKL